MLSKCRTAVVRRIAFLVGGEMGKVSISTASVQSGLNFPVKYKVKDCKE